MFISTTINLNQTIFDRFSEICFQSLFWITLLGTYVLKGIIKIRYAIKNLTFLVRYPNFRSVYLGFSRMRRFSTRYHNISSNESNSLLKKVVFLQFRKGHTYSAHVAMGGGGVSQMRAQYSPVSNIRLVQNNRPAGG